MTSTTQPNAPKKLLRHTIAERWSLMLFANLATRREAKALLFQELAETTRRGMPLDLALEGCMLTSRELDEKITSPGESRGRTIVEVLTTFAYVVFATCGAIFLLIFCAAWAADVERVARIMARRLLPHIRAGYPLSESMSKLPMLFSESEVNAVQAGEQWNNLPAALEKLGQFQFYERKLQRHWSRMAYPLWLGAMMLLIVQFMVFHTLPRMKDIYDQLGGTLPRITQWLIDYGYAPSLLTPFLVLASQLFLLFYTLRLLMVGNRILRNLIVTVFFILTATTFISLTVSLYESATEWMGLAMISFSLMVTAVIYFLFINYMFLGMESGVLALETWFRRKFGRIPLFGAPYQAEMEARWLGALSMAVSNGMTAPLAVENAGRICGRWLAKESDKAAALVRSGHSIGTAVLESEILRPMYANRLRLLDGRGNYVGGLAEIAEDAVQDSFNAMNRASRVGEVLALGVISVIVAVVTLSLYLPLFEIMFHVGTNITE